MLTALLVPVQVLLALIALRGFAQAWHVEVEHDLGADAAGRATPPFPASAT